MRLAIDQLDPGLQPLPWHASAVVQDEDQPALVVCLLPVAVESYTDPLKAVNRVLR